MEAPQMEIIVKAGGTSLNYQLEVTDDVVSIGLSEHGGGGYLWDLVGDSPHTSERHYDRNAPPGSSGTVWFNVRVNECPSFKLEHKRPWVPDEVLDWIKVDVHV